MVVDPVKKSRGCKRIYYFTDGWEWDSKNDEKKKRNERKGGMVNEEDERHLRFIHPVEDVPYIGIRNSTLN